MKSMITSQCGKDLWKHCMKAAVGCEILADKLNIVDSSDAFVVGFLHDLGKMIMNLRDPKTYVKIKEIVAKGMSSVDAENAVFKCNHAEVGSLLAKRWQLPVMVTNCIKYHHDPKASMMQNVVYMVYAADKMVQENVSENIFDASVWASSPIEIEDPHALREAILIKAEALLRVL